MSLQQVAGAGYNAAKERAESTMTPETKAKIDAAKVREQTREACWPVS